jgi:hypothetical protein
MKRLYATLTIRQLKAKISHLSRIAFKITRRFFRSLGFDKRDWSRLTKAQIIKVLDFYYANVMPVPYNKETRKLIELGFEPNPECLRFPESEEIMTTVYGWDVTISGGDLCLFNGGLWVVFETDGGCDYDALIAEIKKAFKELTERSKPIQLSLF